MNSNEIHRRPTKSLRYFISCNITYLDWEGQKKNRKRPLDPQSSTGNKQAKKTTELQTLFSFHWKGRLRRQNQESKRWSPKPRRIIPRLWDLMKETSKSAGPWTSYRSATPLPPTFLLLFRNFYSGYLMSVPPLYAGCVRIRQLVSLVSQFHRLRATILKERHLGSSSKPRPNLDDKILEFELMLSWNFGDQGWEQKYFAHVGMWLTGGQKADCF